MVGELNVLNEWIPEQMHPGTISCWKTPAAWAKRKIPTGRFSPVPTAAPWASSRASNWPACSRYLRLRPVSVQFFINDSDIVIRKPS